jgi:mono/diheme cytochrome c family protein
VATLANVGLISGQLPQPLPQFPAPSDVAASIETRARAYLHANCANCHQPGGKSGVSFDARFQTPLAAMQLCDVNPSKGNFGLLGAKLVKPADPARSLLSLRMHTAIASARMPPTGRTRTDTVGTEIVDAWIASLGACP